MIFVGASAAVPGGFGIDVGRGADHLSLVPVGGAEEGEESRVRSSEPPPEFTFLRQAFPGLMEVPTPAMIPLAILDVPFAVLDAVQGISATADEANLEGATGQYNSLNPSFVDNELLPLGGIASLSWQERTNLINNLRMQLAVAAYKLQGDVARCNLRRCGSCRMRLMMPTPRVRRNTRQEG